MSCADYRNDLSALADQALDAERAARVREHANECPSCGAHLRETRSLVGLLRAAGRVPPPPDLAVALRVRFSQQRRTHLFEHLRVRLRNLMEPVAFPATAGLLFAALMFGILSHSFASHTPAQTESDDAFLHSSPRLVNMPPLGFSTDSDEHGVSVEVHVDDQGRIVDYRLLSGPHDAALEAKLRSVLLFTQFDPATSFGLRRHGTAVFNLRSISVKG